MYNILDGGVFCKIYLLILNNSCIPPRGVFVMANKVIVLPPRSQESRLENDRRPHETRSPIKTKLVMRRICQHQENCKIGKEYVTCHNAGIAKSNWVPKHRDIKGDFCDQI